MVVYKQKTPKNKTHKSHTRRNIPKTQKQNKQEHIIQWKITDKMLEEWNHLSCSTEFGHDCVINSLAFFKLIDIDSAKELSKKTNFRKAGLMPEQIKFLLVDHMTRLYNTKNTHIVESKISLDNKEDVKHFFNKIHAGHGTVIALYSKIHGGHMLVYAKDLAGNSNLFDPQTLIRRTGDEEIIPFIDDSKYINLSYWNLIKNADIDSVEAKPGDLHKRKRGSITPTSFSPDISPSREGNDTNYEIQARRKLTAHHKAKRINSKTKKNSPFKYYDEDDHSPERIKKRRRGDSLPSSFIDDMEKLHITRNSKPFI